MTDTKYTIRAMTRKDIDIAVEWAAREGWNPGIHDGACYFTADPDGFFIGRLDDEPIATISAINYGNVFGFIGFYIVNPEYRGKGYGIGIWDMGMKYLKGLNVGLDGVVAQQENYNKYGFRLAYRNIRYEGAGGGSPSGNPEIVKLSALPFQMIEAYERPFFPSNRSPFLQCWINQPGGHALGIMHKERLAGYGVMRPCRTGYKIGPLFSDSSEIAESIFLDLKSKVDPSTSIFLDTPEINPAAVVLAERHRMKCAFETARMYTGEPPDLPMDRIFGVTSFEIG